MWPHLPAGAVLCNARGVHDASTAELVVGLMIASLRRIPEFVRAQESGTWAYGRYDALADKRVLIVGYGSVGEAIERRLAGFEVEVVRVARSPRPGPPAVEGFDRLHDLLPDADVVVLICPLTDETRGLVDAAFLARMRDGALLVNAARGPVVVTADLLAALESGSAAGRAGRHRPRAAAGRPPALAGAEHPDQPACRRQHDSLPAAGPAARRGAAGPPGCGGGTAERRAAPAWVAFRP